MVRFIHAGIRVQSRVNHDAVNEVIDDESRPHKFPKSHCRRDIGWRLAVKPSAVLQHPHAIALADHAPRLHRRIGTRAGEWPKSPRS